jgi:hypothetical protein
MQRSTVIQNDRGMALPVALFALVVIGALVAGIFFTARIEIRSGENAMAGARAMEAAQAGLQMGASQVILLVGGSPVGTTGGIAKTQLGTTGSYYTDSITKLNNFMFLLRSYGTYEVNGNVTSTRVVAMLIKRYMPELDVNAGAIVAGSVTIQGSVNINGNDAAPATWTGCTTGPSQPSVRSDSTVTVQGGGPNLTPAVSSNDTTVPNMSKVLDTLFMQLASQANFTFTTDPGAAGPVDTTISGTARCNTSRNLNWGDIDHSVGASTHCANYYPLIYLNAGGPGTSIGLHGGSGQGILLVNGDLKMNGNFTFDGLILVRGTYQTGGGTMNLTGSMLSSFVDTDPNKWTGALTVQYSSCAINNALGNLAVTAPATYRGFIQF